DAHVKIGHGKATGERKYGQGSEDTDQGQKWCEVKEHLIGREGHDVFFSHHLHAIGKNLEEAVRSNPVWPQTLLDIRRNLPFCVSAKPANRGTEANDDEGHYQVDGE